MIATQNGEIYNYIELRKDLERRGHAFRTRGDTEAIVHLYEEYGTAFVRHLRGMFAIAIWDGRAGRLILARDRLGKKPLYWRLAGRRLAYGSELKALLEDPRSSATSTAKRSGCTCSISTFRRRGRSCGAFRSFRRPALLDWDGEEARVERYWAPRYGPKTTRAFGDDVEEGLSVLRESVRLRLGATSRSVSS